MTGQVERIFIADPSRIWLRSTINLFSTLAFGEGVMLETMCKIVGPTVCSTLSLNFTGGLKTHSVSEWVFLIC